jgi:hypothetical protein
MRFSEDIPLDEFVGLSAERLVPLKSAAPWPEWSPHDYLQSTILMDRYLAIINAHLDSRSVVIADTGNSCYGSLFMTKRAGTGPQRRTRKLPHSGKW